MPRYRFAVVSWTPPGSDVAVVGGHPNLGDWDPEKGFKMTASLGHERFESEPDYFWANVELPPDAGGATIEFKFVQRARGAGAWSWDEGENRRVTINGAAEDPVLLPVEKFREGTGLEHEHTGRFYSTVKERGEMSARRVSPQLVLGSCPRKKDHILGRMKSLGVTAVMNFQTEEDCLRNFVEGIGMEENALAIRDIYKQAGIEYVWLPTWDMSTAGRLAMLPHASYVLWGLIKNGHTVYVHCNAGVGRSVGAVCGYLHYCVGLSLQQMQHVVARARTVAFFDFPALEGASPHYKAMFGEPSPELEVQRKKLLEDAGLLAATSSSA